MPHRISSVVVACALASTFLCGERASAQSGAGSQPSGLQMAAAIEQSLTAAIAKAEKSVVAIARIKRGDSRESVLNDPQLAPFGGLPVATTESHPGDPDFVPTEFGTGVIIDRNGLILTNYHLLGDDSDYYVTTSERKFYAARIKAADPRSDLAVLAIEASDLAPITFGNGGALKKGQIVIALGNPYAIARDGQASASWGIVSNLQRKAGRTPDESNPIGKSTLHHLGTLIQTDAKLNLGTSGGALLNLQGEMVGLTTSLAAAAGYEQPAGYAIPVDETFRRAVEALKQGREVEYGFLGVQPENLMQQDRLAGRHAARVKDVKPGTPAERDGIEQDDVITHVDGRPIYDSDGLVLHVGSLPAGGNVRLTVERNHKRQLVNVSLAKYRVTGKKVVTALPPACGGLRVDHWTTIVDFRVDPNEAIDTAGCVVITDVVADSPAANTGLKADMIITHVDGTRVNSPQEFQAAVTGKSGKVQLLLSHPTDGGPIERSISAE